MQRLSPEDRALLRSDRDPRSRPTVGGLAVLDTTPDWDLLRTRLDRASRVHRALRERAVEPALATTEPRWVIDPDFHLDRHVRRVALPTPGDRDQLLALVEQVISAPFDPTSPMWSVTCVDGLVGPVGAKRRGAAVIVAASPLVADESGPLDLLALVLDDRHDGEALPPLPVPTDLEPVDLARAGLGELPMRAVGLAVGGVGQAASLAVQAATDPRGVVDKAMALVSSPPPARGSALIAGRGTARRLLTVAVPMERVASAPLHRGAERVHLAAVRAGLLRYHEALGLPTSSLEITETSHPGALRRALAPLSDPVQALGRLFPLLPGGVVDAVVRPSRGADIAISTVRPAGPAAASPAAVERYAVGPVPGNAVTSVALTTADTLFVAVRYDTEAIRDAETFRRCLDEGFEDVLGPAATPARTTRPRAKRPSPRTGTGSTGGKSTKGTTARSTTARSSAAGSTATPRKRAPRKAGS